MKDIVHELVQREMSVSIHSVPTSQAMTVPSRGPSPLTELSSASTIQSLPTYDECAISLKPCSEFLAKQRNHWSLLNAMQPETFHWRVLDRETLIARDIQSHLGNITLNEDAENADYWPGNTITRFLAFRRLRSPSDADKSIALELNSQIEIGRLIGNILSTDTIPVMLYVVFSCFDPKAKGDGAAVIGDYQRLILGTAPFLPI
jgi:hypothetical protein